ncbi:MAG TPA: nuclease-related domain-containing protein [Chitinophagaceae bacterium]|nr:NERD domain-containing protein [Chitinophagaceae bacterium]MCB9056082.1 NERD domain-containing protein [Chitinophagales bacterium]HRX93739.1 nuclease-related domain-containing protein [Chitinophagaceae bacterium]
MKEVMDFQKNYDATQQKIMSDHQLLITKEKNKLSTDIPELNNNINTRKIKVEGELRFEIQDLKQKLEQLSTGRRNIFQRLNGYFKKRSLKKEIRLKENSIDFRVSQSVEYLANSLAEKNYRYQYITSRFTEAVYQSCAVPLKELERKKRIIDEINSFIYGALGEQKVVKELENLSDEYILINDFTCSFQPAIYYKQEDQYIKSIQIDHLLISPAGVFLIETKNWSEQSLNNLNLRSPVEQIKRTNFALFKMLADEASNSNLGLSRHHWGTKKVPIKNLIVLINQKPKEEFQYVKVLTLKELIGYIKYFAPVLLENEREKITNRILSLNQ